MRIAPLLLLASACSTQTVTTTKVVRVVTDPPGARVTVESEAGRRVVGSGPTDVSIDVEVERTEFSSWWWLSVLSGPGLAGIGAGIAVADEGETALFTVGWVMVGTGLAALIGTVIGCAVGEAQEGEEQLKGSEPVTISAALDGFEPARVRVDPTSRSEVRLGLPRVGGAPPPVAAAPASRTHIVAVFDVRDDSGKLDAAVLGQLTNYLGTVLTQTGKYKVIPRDQVRARLAEEKKDSYRACIDESCQIELGKSLAAEKSLATTLIQVGSRCAVTASLFDLETETAEKAASSETGCSPDELLGAMRKIAAQL